jgi:hypothetical protein
LDKTFAAVAVRRGDAESARENQIKEAAKLKKFQDSELDYTYLTSMVQKLTLSL